MEFFYRLPMHSCYNVIILNQCSVTILTVLTSLCHQSNCLLRRSCPVVLYFDHFVLHQKHQTTTGSADQGIYRHTRSSSLHSTEPKSEAGGSPMSDLLSRVRRGWGHPQQKQLLGSPFSVSFNFCRILCCCQA